MTKTFTLTIALSLLIFTACSDDDEKLSVGYAGKDISAQAEIVRDAETKQAILNVFTDNSWTLCYGSSTAEINPDDPFLSKKGKGSYELDVDVQKRYIFQFKTDEGQAIIAERRLPIEGGYNFRDLGGIKNKEGKFIKWGQLYRTDEMSKLTDKDVDYIASTGLKTVIDFRSAGEIQGGVTSMIPPSPDILPNTVKNAYNMPVNAGNIFSDEIMNRIRAGATSDELAQVMMDSYVEMVTFDDYVAVFKQFFAYLQDESNLPLSFHCSGGKDRVGVATMLVLSALDVDKETIMQDYLLSKQYVSGKYDKYLVAIPSIAPLVAVEKEYLEAAFNMIDEKYGSMDNFLTGTLNVDIQKMKNMYLY